MTLMMVVTNALLVWLWVINVRPDKNLGFSACLAVMWGIYILESLWVRLIVTPEQVRLISAHHDRPISREWIYNVRALRWNTVFYDHDQNPILKTRMDLSRRQLLALANELQVNVRDHRAWYGIKELQPGVRLNPEPFPHRPPA